MARLPLLLAASCLGTGALLVAGRALLNRRPPLTPATSTADLSRTLRWAPDPGRRREAALLLVARLPEGADPQVRRRLLRGQGWGPDPLAAVVLKRDALAAESVGLRQRAGELWEDLLHRFPREPATADALYALGRGRPGLRRQLLARFPAHPAALAAALELGPAPDDRLQGGLHLARWGARWPGARDRMRELCLPVGAPPSPSQRALLAGGLAQLGDAATALRCLGLRGTPGGFAGTGGAALAALEPAARLDLARTLLRAQGERRGLAEALLLQVAAGPATAPAEEAVRLLAQQEGPDAEAALARLPARWRSSAPVAAHRLRARLARSAPPSGGGATDAALFEEALEVLRRWPSDPASWDLQWDLTRSALLAARWRQAGELLRTIGADALPPPLAARHRFWEGYVQRQQGQEEAAIASWRRLRLHHPGGYYGWRAARRLGEGDLNLRAASLRAVSRWDPLVSGDAGIDRLWRLDQRTEAWESWRHRRSGRPPRASEELLVEGRLRQGVGDDWTGFGQLEQAALRLPPARCDLLPQLERSLHPPRFAAVFAAAGRRRDLSIDLLMGLSKQESRFTPAVRSPAGAVGLMQVLPSTASELAGAPISAADLEDPARNVDLGSAYLAGMLRRWNRDPLLAVASYNAGPGAVAEWLGPALRAAPELWVEAIPYPETRLYVKKVLGNAWSYQHPEASPRC